MNIFSTRNATLQDSAAIASLATELGYPSNEAQCHARLQGLLLSSEHRVMVACDALNIVVGWIHIGLVYRVESDAFAEIGGLLVTAEYRRNGLGTMLLQDAENWVKKSGVKKLRIRIRTERKEGRAFYESHGFQLDKHQNVFDKDFKNNIPPKS